MKNLDEVLREDAEEVVSYAAALDDDQLPDVLPRLLRILGDTSEPPGRRVKAAFGIRTLAHRRVECDVAFIDSQLSRTLDGLQQGDEDVREATLLAAAALMDSPMLGGQRLAQSAGVLQRLGARRPPDRERNLIKRALIRHARTAASVLDGAWLRSTTTFHSYPCSVVRARHSDGRSGWILQAARVPPGAFNLEVLRSSESTRRAVRRVVIRIPERFRGSPITFGRLAGSADEAEGPADAYRWFEAIRAAAAPDARLQDPVEGVITEQEDGVHVLLFVGDGALAGR